MTTNAVIKVLVVDDHPMVRVGIATIVNQQADMTVAAEAATGLRALELFRQHQPDVVLMDLRLRDDSGIRVTGALRTEFPDARVLVISSSEEAEDIRQALAAGAMGYLFKSAVEDELVDAIRAINAGRSCLPEGVAFRQLEGESGAPLTHRSEALLDEPKPNR